MNKIILSFFIFFIPLVICAQVDIANNSDKIVIKPLSNLNSTARETNLSITPDGKYLYFMSDRGGQSWSYYSGTFRGKPRYDGDIWYAKQKNGVWYKAYCLDSKINTYTGEDEPNISPDGQKVYFQSWRNSYSYDGGPYYYATLNGTQWGNPVGLGGGINKFFVEQATANYEYGTDGMSISPDGKTFIVACGKDYDGNLDMYISHKVKGEWEYPKKMNISTNRDERSIFIAADGKTIYFASDGYGGYGGLDIFKATLDDNGKCKDIVNIGKPFNTSDDDYGFIITADGKQAYFIREGDIYQADLDDNVSIAPGASIVISGIITDCNSKPLEKRLFLYKNSGDEIEDCKSSSEGEYLFSIPDQSGKFLIKDDSGAIIKEFDLRSTNNYQNVVLNLKYCVYEHLVKRAAKSKTN